MQTKINETEHSSSPLIARGIYGFIFACLCASFIVLYFLWIIIPSQVIQTWPYQPPQKYWAAAVPILFCTTLFLFVFFIYPSLHLVHDARLDELSAITDGHAVPGKTTLSRLPRKKRNTLRGLSLKLTHGNAARDKRIDELRETPIPSASDINIEDVSRILYLQEYD